MSGSAGRLMLIIQLGHPVQSACQSELARVPGMLRYYGNGQDTGEGSGDGPQRLHEH